MWRVSPVEGHRAAGVLDRGRFCGERHHPPPLQQPNQAGAIAAGQAAVARMRPGRRLMKAEQVARGPAESGCLLTPLGEEALPVLDRPPPAPERHEIEAAGFEGGKDARVAALRTCELRNKRINSKSQQIISFWRLSGRTYFAISPCPGFVLNPLAFCVGLRPLCIFLNFCCAAMGFLCRRLSDRTYFAYFALRTFARPPSGEVEVAAHG